MQSAHRYKYARCALLAGAEIREVGSATSGTSRDELAVSLDGSVTAILHPAHLDGASGSLPLVQVSEVARAAGVPVIVDAAYLSYPLELIPSFLEAGGDLVCFSAKYFHGPNAGGFVLGTDPLVSVLRSLDFTGYESGRFLTFGRPFKLDRTTIVGTVLALEAWLSMDHGERWESYSTRVARMQAELEDTAGLTAAARQFTLDERVIDAEPNSLTVGFDRLEVSDVAQRLESGDPRIVSVPVGDQLIFAVETIDEADDPVVTAEIRKVALSAA